MQQSSFWKSSRTLLICETLGRDWTVYQSISQTFTLIVTPIIFYIQLTWMPSTVGGRSSSHHEKFLSGVSFPPHQILTLRDGGWPDLQSESIGIWLGMRLSDKSDLSRYKNIERIINIYIIICSNLQPGSPPKSQIHTKKRSPRGGLCPVCDTRVKINLFLSYVGKLLTFANWH